MFKSKILIYFLYPNFVFKIKKTYSDQKHLVSVVDWLKTAQNASGSAGVSAFYDLLDKKWGLPYRETTGYIIPTFVNYAKISTDKEFLERAVNMGNWEIENQDLGGGIGEIMNDGSLQLKIFNTGQVILGMCALYDKFNDKKHLETSIKAANWLLINQKDTGEWKKFSNNGPKTFDSRVAWSLLEVYRRTGDQRYKTSAENHLKWVLGQQKKNGWFQNTGLSNLSRPWTHLIAYTISGLLECYIILKDEKFLKSALIPSEKILEYYKESGYNYLPGTFDQNWESKDKYSCLTGNAQMATIWIKLHKITGDKKFLDGAEKIIEQLKKLQIIKTNNANINGGLAGSHPISGEYAAYKLPNWVAKFFADALMLKENPDLPLLS